MNKTDFITCKYKNYEYLVPATVLAQHSFDTVSLDYNGVELMNSITYTYAPANRKHSPMLTLYGVETLPSHKLQEELDENITLYLYRKGNREPLCKHVCDIYMSEHYINLEAFSNELEKCGEFFILMDNMYPRKPGNRMVGIGSAWAFEFEVLPSGETLEQPEIENATVHPLYGGNSRTRDTGISLPDKLSLELVLGRAAAPTDEYKVKCYSSSLFLISENCCLGRNMRGNKKRVSIALDTPYIWMPGDYACVVEHNGEPFYRVDFTVSGRKHDELKATGYRLCKTSPFYTLVKEIEKKYGSYWKEMRSVFGYTPVRLALMDNFRKYCMFERLFRQLKKETIYLNSNFIFTGEEDACTESMLINFGGIISDYSPYYIDCAQASANEMDNGLMELLSNVDHKVLYLTGVSSLFCTKGAEFIKALIGRYRKIRDFAIFIVATKQECGQLFMQHPQLASLFPSDNRIELGRYSFQEIIWSVQHELERKKMALSPAAKKILVKKMLELYNGNKIKEWNMASSIEFIDNSIIPNYRERLLNSLDCGISDDLPYKQMQDAALVRPGDIDWQSVGVTGPSFESCVASLNGMIGLSSVKETVATAANISRFNILRKKMGCSALPEMPHHMIFTGNPGTGKTTVAKMVGRIYHSLGLLSKGDVIVTERSKMVGRYIGETESTMNELMERARGNVLFIDEAYNLCADVDDKKDYGHKALDSLLTLLSQKDSDTIVIMAGYEKEMENMLCCNPGLKSRFPYKLHFDDYTAPELMQIAKSLLAKDNFEFTAEAASFFFTTLEQALLSKDKNFGNVRWVEQYIYNAIVPSMANRLFSSHSVANKHACSLIQLADVEAGFMKMKGKEAAAIPQRYRIGFRA